jgi:hypothetical protein
MSMMDSSVIKKKSSLPSNKEIEKKEVNSSSTPMESTKETSEPPIPRDIIGLGPSEEKAEEEEERWKERHYEEYDFSHEAEDFAACDQECGYCGHCHY